MSKVLVLPGRNAPTLPDLADAIAGFLERCRLRGAAPNTIAAYASDLTRAMLFFAGRGVTLPQLVGPRLVEAWIDDMAREGIGARSRARRLAALRSLARYLMAEGLIDENPTDTVAVRFRPAMVVAPEMSALLAMIRRIRADTPADQRDRALLRLMLDCGLRISEACDLDVHDPKAPGVNQVDLARLSVAVAGKGGVVATVPFDPVTARELEAWLAVRERLAGEGERALFVNARGGRLHRQTVHRMVKARGAAAGMPQLHAHMLRHRRVGQVVETLGIETGRQMARHRHASTTMNVYGAQAAEVVLRQIRKHCPLEARP